MNGRWKDPEETTHAERYASPWAGRSGYMLIAIALLMLIVMYVTGDWYMAWCAGPGRQLPGADVFIKYWPVLRWGYVILAMPFLAAALSKFRLGI